MKLHDSHMIPEPILVISGLSYLFPLYVAYKKNNKYALSTYVFLTFTTIGFHGTRYEWFFILDCLAICNFIFQTLHLSLSLQSKHLMIQIIYIFSIVYSLTSYFIGFQYSILSFHPDWNTQMFYHSLMHFFTSYSAYIMMNNS